MQNLLDSIKETAGEAIVQTRMVEQFPDLPSSEEISNKCDEVYNTNKEGLREDIKKKRDEIKNKMSNSIESGKQKAIDSINNAKEQCKQAIEEVTADLNDLGTSAGLLTVGSVDFLSRIAMVPPAIISTTPMGPGVSPSLIPPMLKDLMAEGNQLSKQYDDCTSKMNKLGLDRLAGLGKSRASSDLLNNVNINFGAISSITSIVQNAMSVAKPLILATGASVGGDTGEEPSVESPIEIEYNARDCTNFLSNIIDPDADLNVDITAEDCLNFIEMISGNGTTCNNCKNYNKK